MSNLRPTTRKPGEGRKGPFTKEQNEVIQRSMDAWHHYAFVENPVHEGQGVSGKLTKWKQTEAKKIMKDSAFDVLPDGLNYSQTFKAVVRKFTNYRNMRKNLIDDQTTEIKALQEATAALIDLKTATSGRELFKEEMHADILSRRTMIVLGNPDISMVGAYAKALAELWAEADQPYWESKAESISPDIHKNRERLDEILFPSLRGLCQCAGLGNLELLLLLAFRDDGGRVATSLLEAHHDDSLKPFSKSEAGGVIGRLRSAYERWAEQVLPEDPDCTLNTPKHFLKRDSDGLPRFPSIDLDEENFGSLRKLLQVYFEYVWKHCNPSHPLIPWEELASRPSDYYDSDAFSMDAPIDHPSKLTNAELYALVAELLEHSNIDSISPFRFKAMSDAMKDEDVEPNTPPNPIPSGRSPPPLPPSNSPAAPRTPSPPETEGFLSRPTRHDEMTPRIPSPPETEHPLSQPTHHEVNHPLDTHSSIRTSDDVTQPSSIYSTHEQESSLEHSPPQVTNGDLPSSHPSEGPPHSNTDISDESNRQSALSPALPSQSCTSSKAAKVAVMTPASQGDTARDQHPGNNGDVSPSSGSRDIRVPGSPSAIKDTFPPTNPFPHSPTPPLVPHPPPPESVTPSSPTHPLHATVSFKEGSTQNGGDSQSADASLLSSGRCSSGSIQDNNDPASAGGDTSASDRAGDATGAIQVGKAGGRSGTESEKKDTKNSRGTKGGGGRGRSEKQKKTGRTGMADGVRGGVEKRTKAYKVVKTGPDGGDGDDRGRGGTGRITRSAVGERNYEETSNLRGRKRPRPDSESEDIYNRKVRLLDGRQGVFTRDKRFKGGYFCEDGKDTDAEWMNDPWSCIQMPSLI